MFVHKQENFKLVIFLMQHCDVHSGVYSYKMTFIRVILT